MGGGCMEPDLNLGRALDRLLKRARHAEQARLESRTKVRPSDVQPKTEMAGRALSHGVGLCRLSLGGA